MSGPEVPEYIRRLAVYVPGKPIEEVQRELGVSDIVKLASNENPLGPSPRAVAAIREALPSLNRYPDGSGFALRRELAARLGVDIEQTILGSGSVEIIEMLARAFMADADEAVFSQQSFISYQLAVNQVNGRAVTPAATAGRAHDLPAMARALSERTKLVYLANPCNPTGTYFTRRELVRFLAEVDERALVVVDQAYHEYVDRPDYPDALDDVKAGRNVMVLRTFSKVYGLAGLRIGYGVALPDHRNGQPRAISVQHLFARAGGRDGGPRRRRVAAHVARAQLAGTLVPSGRTLAAEDRIHAVGGELRARRVRDRREGALRRVPEARRDHPPCRRPGLVDCARVSVGTRPENDRFLAALDQLVPARVGSSSTDARRSRARVGERGRDR